MKHLVKRALQIGTGAIAPQLWRFQRDSALMVLMYHRVLPAQDQRRATEQPGMFVAPETLDMHLEVLRRHFELVHLDDWVRRNAAGDSLPKRACALTFDDGWRDNYEYAFPILERHRAPAMIFLVSKLIGTNTEFWPNRLGRLLSSVNGLGSLPRELAELLAPAFSRSRADSLRTGELDLAISLAKQVDEATLVGLLDEAERMNGAAESVRAVLNEEELLAMDRSGLVRYGSHTRTHLRCREGVPLDLLEQEIRDSRTEIANAISQPVEIFCYPNGDTTPAAVDIVSRHYAAAVTTNRGWHRPGSNRYIIPRVGVHEDISNTPDAFLARISGWL